MMQLACAPHKRRHIRLAAEITIERIFAHWSDVRCPGAGPQVQLLEGRVLLSAYTPSQLGQFGVNASGANPTSMLVADSAGNLYGTALDGGADSDGTVFELPKGSAAITTLVTFNGNNGATPYAGLTIDSSGNLFGTTESGGASNDGTVFEIAKGSNALTTLVAFNGTNGANPYGPLTLDGSGNLYGTTSAGANGGGTVFKIAKGSARLSTVATFSPEQGFGPQGGVTLDTSGDIFGTTRYGGANGDGTVFEIPAGSNVVTALASFSSSTGANPQTAVVLDALGDLYGTTSAGGSSSGGTVYELAEGSTTITVVASLSAYSGAAPLTIDSSGDLYGTTMYGGSYSDGSVFEIASGTSTLSTVASLSSIDSRAPQGGVMLDASGNLFGTAADGGNGGSGTVFEIPKGTAYPTTLAQFDPTNATEPYGHLVVDSFGNLYGTTLVGGTSGDGTVFEIPNGSTTLTVLASFTGANGATPFGGLTIDGAGNLFGVTQLRGMYGYGTVFEVASGSNAISTLASFQWAQGANPQVGLTQDAAGNLYGTTPTGGANGFGTAFEVANGSHAITVLTSFTTDTGLFGEPAVDASGDLYDITQQGGSSGDGTVIEVAKGSSTVTTLATFNGTNGADPLNLALDASADLYGTTRSGGPNGGLVFEIPHGLTALTTVATLSGVVDSPTLLIDGAGNLYGTSSGGGAFDRGSVVEVAYGSGTMTTIMSFNVNDGDSPESGVTSDPYGNLYVMASQGGPGNAGTLFKLAANTAVTLASTSGSNPSTAAQPLTFNVMVTGGVPDGETVSLEDASNNNVVVATGALSGGSATLTIPPGTLVAAGIHNLIAVYGGDANFASSESAPYTQTVLVDVTGISPSSGPAIGGTSITITGSGFAGAAAVDFGANPATSFTVNAAGTQITAVDPAGSGTVDVTVVTSGGTSATSPADQFTYTAASLPSWLASGSQATWNASTDTLTVTGATTIIADPGSDEPNIVASGSSAIVTVDPATSPTDIHIGGVTLTDGASIVMSDVDASQVAAGTNAANHHSDHNVLVIGTLGAVNNPMISIDSASKLDLGDNDLIIHTGSSDTGTTDVQGYMETNELQLIDNLASEGRNVAPGGVYDGNWNGNGLTSSAAATADDWANAGYEQNILAVEQNSDMYLGGYSSWTVGSATEKLGPNDIIVKYTYNGDLNLDGAVDGNAATIFSTFYDNGDTSGNTYAYGDLNGDGKINGNDATIFSTVYGNGLASSGLPQL